MRAPVSHPCHPARCSSPRQGIELPRRATPRLLGLPRGSPREPGRRCSSPTSATDLRYAHSWFARFSRNGRLAAPVSSRGPFDDGPRASGDSSTPPGGGGAAPGGAISPRRFRPRAQTGDSPSDTPVAPASPPGEPAGGRWRQDRFRRPDVNQGGFPGRGAFHRQVLLSRLRARRTWKSFARGPGADAAFASLRREPATGVVALPPPTRLPTSLRLPDGSRPGGLDRAPRVRVIARAWEGPDAACRLLQSMTIREHNCSTVRTPRTVVVVAHGDSSSRGWLRALRHVANRGLTGQGPSRDEPSLAPPAVIAHGGASPQPDRLGHLLSRARGAGAGGPTSPGID